MSLPCGTNEPTFGSFVPRLKCAYPKRNGHREGGRFNAEARHFFVRVSRLTIKYSISKAKKGAPCMIGANPGMIPAKYAAGL